MATEYLWTKHTAGLTVYFRFVDPSNDKVWDFNDDQWENNVGACTTPKRAATEKTDYGDADESYYVASYDMTSVNSTATPKEIMIQAMDDLGTDEIIAEAEAWVVSGVLLSRADMVQISAASANEIADALLARTGWDTGGVTTVKTALIKILAACAGKITKAGDVYTLLEEDGATTAVTETMAAASRTPS